MLLNDDKILSYHYGAKQLAEFSNRPKAHLCRLILLIQKIDSSNNNRMKTLAKKDHSY